MRRKSVQANLNVSNVQGSTIIGHMEGLDENAIQQMFDRETAKITDYIDKLISAAQTSDPAPVITALEQPKPLALSLYVCKATGGGQSVGFAIDTSGSVITISSLGEITSAVNLSSGQEVSAVTSQLGSLLQLVGVPSPTFPVVPAPVSAWGSDRELEMATTSSPQRLYAFDHHGGRQELRPTLFSTRGLEVMGLDGGDRQSYVDGLVGCEVVNGVSLIGGGGGPVFTDRDEVCGILIAQSRSMPSSNSAASEVAWFAPWSTGDLESLTTARIVKRHFLRRP